MHTVRDDADRRYLLVGRSGETCRVRDPATGDERDRPCDHLERTDESPLGTLAGTISSPVRSLLTAVPSEQALGLLLELDRRGPVAVETLLADYDMCESDLHGQLTEFRLAGLVTASDLGTTVTYESTPEASAALDALRDA